MTMLMSYYSTKEVSTAHLQHIEDLLCDLDSTLERLADNDAFGKAFKKREECVDISEITVDSSLRSDFSLMLHPG
jgi:hypothetical protein